MSARPIVLSAPMVRAILAGTKTQVRRPIGLPTLKPSATAGYDWTFRGLGGARTIARHQRHPRGCWQDLRAADFFKLCPHGAPGDLLWVRETWAYYGGDEYLYQREPGAVAYRASYDEDTRIPIHMRLIGYVPGGRWRPSIHMPQWASRLTLRVTSVRVERLREITEEDARAEGFAPSPHPSLHGVTVSARHAFARTWHEMHGDGFAIVEGSPQWNANPWVWVLGFERVGGAS